MIPVRKNPNSSLSDSHRYNPRGGSWILWICQDDRIIIILHLTSKSRLIYIFCRQQNSNCIFKIYTSHVTAMFHQVQTRLEGIHLKMHLFDVSIKLFDIENHFPPRLALAKKKGTDRCLGCTGKTVGWSKPSSRYH